MLKVLALVVGNILLLASCAKEKEYKEVHRTPELQARSSFKINKTVIDENGNEKVVPVKYLYVPMSLGTPREVKGANPFYQGGEKIVRLAWGEKGLQVLQMELDERYSDNDLNDTPVMTIPGDYRSYRCTEDAYGECKNEEEENEDLQWHEKAYFEPKFSELAVEELNFLDLVNIEADDCVTQQKTDVVDYEISDGVINIQLEKTYRLKNSWECVFSNYVNDKLDYNSFRVRYFYSLVELEQLTTKGYQAVNYPVEDHGKFGFFKNERAILDDIFDPSRPKDEILMNRWAPKRKNNKLTYYLSKTFNKPENRKLLEATYRSADIINEGLKAANIPFTFELIQQEESAKEISPGDLRYNTIVLIDDPLANGLLGYGPTVTNPLTGEIVQGHVNMYGGVLTSTVRRVYNSAVDLSYQKQKAALSAKEKAQNEENKILKVTLDKNAIKTLPPALGGASADQQKSDQLVSSTKKNYRLSHLNQREWLQREFSEALDEKQFLKRIKESNFEGLDPLTQEYYKNEIREKGLLNTVHTPEFFEIGGTIKTIPRAIRENRSLWTAQGYLKKWTLLTNEQRLEVRDILLVDSYIATFIHEMGHNLGLRHNFAGSMDKDNFYTEEEAKALGMESAPAYSSIMDYAFSNFNELNALGKYDLAALKFGYNRKVEATIGKDVPMDLIGKLDPSPKKGEEPTILVEKDYMFCTDENAGLNTSCMRFDEGTTLVEITQHKIDRYKDEYKSRNFRDERKQFNSYSMFSYIFRVMRDMAAIRDVFEDYERFAAIFGPGIMERGCTDQEKENPRSAQTCVMIQDRIDAVALAADFFLEILKTPDHLCALAAPDKQDHIVKLEKLSDVIESIRYSIDSLPKSCYDSRVVQHLSELREPMVVIGENGKFLNGIQSLDRNKHKYQQDRDALGIWVDKALALRNLFMRTSMRRTTDTGHMALVDIAPIRSKVFQVIEHLLVGQKLADPLPFKNNKGQQFTVPYVIGDDYQIEQMEDVFWFLKPIFGLPSQGKANLAKVMLKQSSVKGLNFDYETAKAAYPIVNFATVMKLNPLSHVNSNRGVSKTQVHSIKYVAQEENALAKTVIDFIENLEFWDTVDLESELELAQKVIRQRTNPTPPEELSPEQLAFFKLPANLQDTLIGFKKDEAELSEEVLKNALGEEVGSLIFAFYQQDLKELKSIKQLKINLATIPAADASQMEKELFQKSLFEFQMKFGGKYTQETVNYYKDQLNKFPNHVEYSR